MKPVRKVVFPVNGLGTRFLPATKAMPKEMLPVVDKPLIQYAVEEAAAAGVTEMIFVTGRNKRAIEDHFDTYAELERELEMKGKQELLEIVREIVPPGVRCIYIRQPQPLGLGHAVLCARPVVENSPFGVILADDLIDAGRSCIGQLIEARARQGGGAVLAVQDVAPEETKKYGIVSVDDAAQGTPRLRGIVDRKYSIISKRFRLVSAVKFSSPMVLALRLKPCPPTRIALRVRVLTAAASRASLMRLFTLHASVASASADRETN